MRMNTGMTPAALPPMIAPVLIENVAGVAIVGAPAMSRTWNTVALRFTGAICNKKIMFF